ncbi:MAG: hypothetical protein V4812_18835 [Pseudomonadota bacterium]
MYKFKDMGFYLALFFSLSASAADKEDFSALFFSPPPLAHFDTRQDALFDSPDLELMHFIDAFGDKGLVNHFCVVGYSLASGRKEAVVYWTEKAWLTRWAGSDATEFRSAYSLAHSKTLDLKTDLVETADDINGSSFLTVRSQAEAVVADCEKHGVQYSIDPFVPPSEEE